MQKLSFCLIAIVCALLLPSRAAIALPAAFQTQAALPRLRGVILDPSGGLMPSVDVAVLQGTTVLKAGRTDAMGAFSFDLSPGSYQLAVTAPDFKVHAQPVRVVPNMPSLSITLSLQGITSFVEVKDGEPEKEIVADASRSIDSTVITAEQLKDLPDDEESLLAFLQAMAGGEGNAQLIIDGFEGGRLPTRDQIAQIVIEPNSFNANGTGPRITITSRQPGPTRWAGNASFRYQDSALNARTPGSVNKPTSRRSVVSTSYNGPVIKGKWGMTVSLSKQQSEASSNALRAVTPAGPVNSSFVSPSTFDTLSLTNNLFVSPSNSMLVGFSYNRNKNLKQGIGGFTLEERASDNKSHGWNLQVSDNITLSPKMTDTFQFRVNRNLSNTKPVTNAVAINVLDAFNGGGAQNLSDSRNLSFNLNNIVRWTPTPKWNLTLAFNSNYQSSYTFSQSNYLGTFTFSSLSDYLAGRALTFTQTSGDPVAETRHIDANASLQGTYRINANMSASVGAQYSVQNHFKDYNNFSPTAQYQVQVKKKTTISLGARMTHPNVGFPVFYYEQLLRGNGTSRQFNTVISNPSYPDPFAGGAAGVTAGTGSSIMVRGPHFESPYALNTQLSVTQAFPKNWRLTTSYGVTRQVHQIRTRNINAPFPGSPLDPTLTRDQIDRLRPFFPLTGRVNQLESTGDSFSKSLNFVVQIPSTKKLLKTQITGTFRYGLTWAQDNSSAENPYNIRADWATNDQRHNFQGTFSVRPPVVGSFSLTLSGNSGRNYSITTGKDDNFDQSFLDRPAGVARNSLRGPGSSSVGLNYSTPPFSLRRKKKAPALAQTPPTGAAGTAVAAGGGTTAIDSLIQSALAAGLPAASIQSLITAISSQPGFLDGAQVGAAGANTQPTLSHPQMTFSVNVQNLFNNTRINAYSGVITSPLFGKATSYGRGREIFLTLSTRF